MHEEDQTYTTIHYNGVLWCIVSVMSKFPLYLQSPLPNKGKMPTKYLCVFLSTSPMIDILVVMGREAGYSLGRSSAYHMANTERDRQLFLLTVTPIAALESPANLTSHPCVWTVRARWSTQKASHATCTHYTESPPPPKSPAVQHFQRRHSAILIVI